MSIEIFNKIFDELNEAIASETDPVKAEQIAKDYESKIDAAEIVLEEAFDKEIADQDAEIEKEFLNSLPKDDIEIDKIRLIPEELLETYNIINDFNAKKAASKVKVSKVRMIATIFEINSSKIKEVDLIQLIKDKIDVTIWTKD